MQLVGRYSPRDEAQELMSDATEMVFDDRDQAVKQCRKALTIYPDCVDAIMMLSVIEGEKLPEHIKSLRRAVEAGRRDLGPKFFGDHKGLFWDLVESRPFMSAMQYLANSLVELGGPEAVDEAIILYEEMLDLNPNDNQGVRDWLSACYLQQKRYDDAEKLFQRYPEDWLAAPVWAKMLHAYATRGEEAAAQLLPEARKRNRHIELYLSGIMSIPHNDVSYYAPGEQSEAAYCMTFLWQAWNQHPDAKKWLKKRVMNYRKPSSRAGKIRGRTRKKRKISKLRK